MAKDLSAPLYWSFFRAVDCTSNSAANKINWSAQYLWRFWELYWSRNFRRICKIAKREYQLRHVSETDYLRSKTTQLWNLDMSASSNHTMAFVQCCHDKQTVASSRTLLSDHVCRTVCQSTRNNSPPTRRIFMKFDIWGYLQKSV